MKKSAMDYYNIPFTEGGIDALIEILEGYIYSIESDPKGITNCDLYKTACFLVLYIKKEKACSAIMSEFAESEAND